MIKECSRKELEHLTSTGSLYREYLDNLVLFQGCSDKLLDAASVLLREVQVCSP